MPIAGIAGSLRLGAGGVEMIGMAGVATGGAWGAAGTIAALSSSSIDRVCFWVARYASYSASLLTDANVS